MLEGDIVVGDYLYLNSLWFLNYVGGPWRWVTCERGQSRSEQFHSMFTSVIEN